MTLSIRVTGKVQGVFYRQSTREKAQQLGLTGEVMNLPDGSVQIRATGTKPQLEELLNWCKEGPPRAKVLDVVASELPVEHFGNFSIKR
mgnify:CR=1 FL=1